jgi:hypothetical protein
MCSPKIYSKNLQKVNMKLLSLFQKQTETSKTLLQSEGGERLPEDKDILCQELSPIEMSKISGGGVFGGPPMRPDLPAGYGRIPL